MGRTSNSMCTSQAYFDPDDDTIPSAFSTDYHEDGGIFFYTPQEKERVLNTNVAGKEGNLRFIPMAAYMIELGYDLAIGCGEHNVSGSFGFEVFGIRSKTAIPP